MLSRAPVVGDSFGGGGGARASAAHTCVSLTGLVLSSFTLPCASGMLSWEMYLQPGRHAECRVAAEHCLACMSGPIRAYVTPLLACH